MTAAAQCTNLASLSSYLGFAPQHLFYLVNLGDDLYIEIRIPKRSNKSLYRRIQIPCTELKGVQRSILHKVLSENTVSRYAHAYVRGKSIVDAARLLSGKQSVYKLDLKNFFPSISSARVFGLYRSLGFNEDVSWILMRLGTYNSTLCQGAPTSPYISNLICRRLDNNLAKMANSWGLSYLRYSDDLFFYGAKNFRHKVFLNYVRRIVKENGFQVNAAKTKYHPIGQPRFTLGLATHGDTPALPRDVKRKYRAAFFKASRDLKWARENIEELSGMGEWYRAVYGQDDTYNEYRKTISNVRMLRLHEPYAI